ncbi:ribonuclease E inhibitor RraB [Demequina sp. TTPB684]|uniref:ribonuclease E inhibitor RraB n=1 Tax=unclassified Demequina TaxID=2620311 RepID=UPI001CF47C02|nr:MULTISPECIES: ribonuclease E inhibitor RraB [unclassified Demequina]MCB2412882.1 ribonuclease E inhibitor RraB [Demequina sp. TTPB684]UPU88140.1 ribonuclease E inhibitor RraB [Demequina sp. TMPB413]
MGILDRFRRDRPLSDAELDERSQVDGIKYRDLQIVGQLTQVGADIKAPRPTVFYLYFPAHATAMAAADALGAEGFAAAVGPLPEEYLAEHPDAPNPWRVTAERSDRALVPDFLREAVDRCAAIADEFGGEYDGWECGLNDAEVAAVKAQRG